MAENVRIHSWNVNGLRAVLKKNFPGYLDGEKPDVLGLQEIKISDAARVSENIAVPGYAAFWNPAKRPGYSGTATLVKDSFIKKHGMPETKNGFGEREFDEEGRIQITEFSGFYFVNTYFPNANAELSRLKYKIDFSNYWQNGVEKLTSKKPVVACGDFNVAHNEIDLAHPKENAGKHGFTKEEREWMGKFLGRGYADTFRALNGNKVKYSWWSYFARARERNLGWRIDYFIVSSNFLKKVKKAYILDGILGSDHCPVGIDAEI